MRGTPHSGAITIFWSESSGAPSSSVKRGFASRASAATALSRASYSIASDKAIMRSATIDRPLRCLREASSSPSLSVEGDRFELTVIPAVVNRTWLVNALVESGDFAAGMSHAKRALEIAENAEHPLSQVLGWLSVGHLLLRKGEIEGAVGALERGFELCDRWSLLVWRPRLGSTLGVAYARSGRSRRGATVRP